LAGKKFDNEVHLLASSIPFNSSSEEVYKTFEKLENYDDQRIKGIFFLYYNCLVLII
jgi:hypothetical protein